MRKVPSIYGYDLLWTVPRLKIDLSRGNASTQGRKTDLVERYQHYAIAFFAK